MSVYHPYLMILRTQYYLFCAFSQQQSFYTLLFTKNVFRLTALYQSDCQIGVGGSYRLRLPPTFVDPTLLRRRG